MKNIILMVLNQGFPDVRVCQEANALKEAGYEVWVVVSSLDTRSPEYLAADFNTILLDLSVINTFSDKLRALGYSHPALVERLLNLPEIQQIQHRIVVVHTHDLHWCRFGWDVAQRLGAKFVADFHENSPALPEYFGSRILSKSPKQTVYNVFRSRFFLQYYEAWVVRRSHAVITVAPENAERLKARHQKDEIYCVSNTKDPKTYEYMGLSENQEITLIYHGSIQKNRGLKVLSEAFSRVDTSRMRLVILGFHPDSKDKAEVIQALGGVKPGNVDLLDWTSDFTKIKELVRSADIGVIPHDSCELTHTTLPNKIFEYFCYGKPVIVSDVAPLKRIVEETRSGLVFNAGDPDDLARCLSQMANKSLLHEMSRNARNAAEGAYSWQTDRAQLLNIYQEVSPLSP